MVGDWHPREEGILAALGDGKVKGHRETVEATGLSDDVRSSLKSCWRKDLALRGEKPSHESPAPSVAISSPGSV